MTKREKIKRLVGALEVVKINLDNKEYALEVINDTLEEISKAGNEPDEATADLKWLKDVNGALDVLNGITNDLESSISKLKIAWHGWK